MDKLKPSGKPFDISKQEVWEAHRQARANQGASGVDGVMTLDEFEKEFCGGPDLGREYQRMGTGLTWGFVPAAWLWRRASRWRGQMCQEAAEGRC